jgi:hypothetical protein
LNCPAAKQKKRSFWLALMVVADDSLYYSPRASSVDDPETEYRNCQLKAGSTQDIGSFFWRFKLDDLTSLNEIVIFQSCAGTVLKLCPALSRV